MRTAISKAWKVSSCFLEGNSIATSIVEVNEDGTEGEPFLINEEL
jgi:hypothetical protein